MVGISLYCFDDTDNKVIHRKVIINSKINVAAVALVNIFFEAVLNLYQIVRLIFIGRMETTPTQVEARATARSGIISLNSISNSAANDLGPP